MRSAMNNDASDAGAADGFRQRHVRPKNLDISSNADDEARAQRDRERILDSPTFKQAKSDQGFAALTPNSARIARREQARAMLLRRFLKPSPVVFLDWDDTILPTSWLAAPEQRVRHISSVRMDLLPVANATQSLLEELNRLECHVSIVTNADKGWVEETCSIFFPSLLYLINPDEQGPNPKTPPRAIPPPHVVSARHCFEELHPRQPTAWKAGTFAWELHRLLDERRSYKAELQRKARQQDAVNRERSLSADSATSQASTASNMSEGRDFIDAKEDEKTSGDIGNIEARTARMHIADEPHGRPGSAARNGAHGDKGNGESDDGMAICDQIVSVGDSDHEHEACHLVAKQFSTRAKTMHLQRRGAPDVIRRQLDMITASLPSFLAVAANVDVDVDI